MTPRMPAPAAPRLLAGAVSLWTLLQLNGCGGLGLDPLASYQGSAEGGGEEGGGAGGSGGSGGSGGDGSVIDSGLDDTDSGEDTADGPWDAYGLLSLNLHCLKLDGTSYSSNTERFAAIAQVVADEDISVLALQEVCDNGTTSSIDALADAVIAATGDAWYYEWVITHTAWSGTSDEAQEGVGLLVRGALTDVTTVTYAKQGGLKRGTLAATLPERLGGFRVWTMHLDNDDPNTRALQARETVSAALVDADPELQVLVAGDLNDTTSSDSDRAFSLMGFEDLSDGLSSTRIDHVYTHRATAVAVKSASLRFDGSRDPEVSDHPGVLITLKPVDASEVAITRITANVDAGSGNTLSVRGDTAPLDWSWGWPMRAEGTNRWKAVFTELPEASFSYKVLLNDLKWQAGDNVTGTGGQDNETSPTF